MESLKNNKEIKGLPHYVGEHILPVLEKKTDQTVKRVLELLDIKYGRTRTEKIKNLIEEWMKFSPEQFKDDGELLLGMKDLNQRRKDLKMSGDEWVAAWMLGIVKKRKKVDKSIYQALMNLIKEGGDKVLENFEQKFKKTRIEGCQRDTSAASVLYGEEDLPDNCYTEEDMEEIETMYMGTESEARKRYQRKGPPSRRQSFSRPRFLF